MSNFLPHQQRVINEADELLDKINNLNIFITGNSVSKMVALDELVRLKLQLTYMKLYHDVLEARINCF